MWPGIEGMLVTVTLVSRDASWNNFREASLYEDVELMNEEEGCSFNHLSQLLKLGALIMVFPLSTLDFGGQITGVVKGPKSHVRVVAEYQKGEEDSAIQKQKHGN